MLGYDQRFLSGWSQIRAFPTRVMAMPLPYEFLLLHGFVIHSQILDSIQLNAIHKLALK